jgi:hypothetical protein
LTKLRFDIPVAHYSKKAWAGKIKGYLILKKEFIFVVERLSKVS